MSEMPSELPPVTQVAALLAKQLEGAGCDYALGGAVALAYWSEPRGTVDVDVSLYLSPTDPGETIHVLHEIAAEFSESNVRDSLSKHGFCSILFSGRRLDVFLPIADIYHAARSRRQRISIGDGAAWIWDAETLCVFKMMFFRRKDLADVEGILRMQQRKLDASWVEQRLLELYGKRDPRLNQWQELVDEAQAN